MSRPTVRMSRKEQWPSEIDYRTSRLIYDVGMNNGDDCAYYLSQGYDVVAIEANPILVQRARERFAKEIDHRKLLIEWVGIVDQPGKVPFWICDERDVFSSFDRTRAGRNGLKCHPIEIECVTFDAILRKYGTPHYLKIDIEGAEPHCLKHLQPLQLPQYISLEAEDLQWLVLLQQLGYSEFKIVDQMRHNSSLPNFSNATMFSRSAKKICWYADRFKNRLGCPLFPRGSSGPFGEQTPGEWQSFDEVASNWLHMRWGHSKRGTLNRHSWFDFHARAFPNRARISEMPSVKSNEEKGSLSVA
ncbi:MAG TPA: FkbM family methyltransferase [Candidatus Sulfotelmatobacter sp.]|nr:FkbM family methyltransferase [Candidatus Sulfotelmatobacter sp.]